MFTTSFLRIDDATFQPAGLDVMDNRYYFRFGLPSATAPTPPATQLPQWTLRPQFALHGGAPWQATGYDFQWYPTGWWYRSTVADVSPHLLPDIHPYWIGPLAGAVSNPIWQADRSTPTVCGTTLYNPILYSNPTESAINPAGTYIPSMNWLWLDDIFSPPAYLIGGTHFVTSMAFNIDGFDDWMRPRLSTVSSSGYHETFVLTGTPSVKIVVASTVNASVGVRAAKAAVRLPTRCVAGAQPSPVPMDRRPQGASDTMKSDLGARG